MLADYAKADGGIKFIHDNELAPGVSIGEHTHHADEEVYFILTGTGQMRIDSVLTPVGPGDACLTRRGHSHSLTNTGDTPMRMLVIGVNP
jgi:mannose-6-phosphate isomerase-like protein (cupin superfamily)